MDERGAWTELSWKKDDALIVRTRQASAIPAESCTAVATRPVAPCGCAVPASSRVTPLGVQPAAAAGRGAHADRPLGPAAAGCSTSAAALKLVLAHRGPYLSRKGAARPRHARRPRCQGAPRRRV